MAVTSNSKRKYRRRTEEERIEELEERIEELKAKVASKHRKDSPLLKQVPALQKRLRRFAELAVHCNRQDVYNTTVAFLAGLDRVVNEDQADLKHWNTVAEEDEQ